jgi:cell division septum initiation protein DivIVA
MTEDGPSRVRLRVAARGYDRDEVDARLVANDRAAVEFQSRLHEIEGELTEADERANALEAKIAELEHRGADGPPESVQWLHDVTDQILRVTSDDAHELMIKMENEAKAEKQAAEQAGAEMLAAAEARAAKILEAARFDQDTGSKMRLESHQQVDLYLDQGRAMAEERSGAVWNDAQARIQEVRLERERVEDQRRSLLDELNHVRGNVRALESYLGHDQVPETESAPATESAEDDQPRDVEPSWP